MKNHYSTALILAMVGIFGFYWFLRASQTSDRIETAAGKSYVFRTYLKNENIRVQSTNDGVAILTGIVSNAPLRTLAVETVANLPTVKGVNNELQLKDNQPPENSDEGLALKARTLFLFHRNLDGAQAEINVIDGVMRLSGKAVNEAQKQSATEFAWNIEGVQNVYNDMIVMKEAKPYIRPPAEDIDDASISAQIKVELMFHYATRAYAIKAKTDNGIVTLSGITRNTAESDLVAELVSDIHGVKRVWNNITIEPELTD